MTFVQKVTIYITQLIDQMLNKKKSLSLALNLFEDKLYRWVTVRMFHQLLYFIALRTFSLSPLGMVTRIGR